MYQLNLHRFRFIALDLSNSAHRLYTFNICSSLYHNKKENNFSFNINYIIVTIKIIK